MRKVLWIVLIGMLAVSVGFYGYERLIGTSGSKEVTIKKDTSQELAVKVRFGAGNLVIQGGSTEWMDGTFDYKRKKVLPHVSYKSKRGTGVLIVEQKSTLFGFSRKNLSSQWDIQLSTDIPIDLNVDMGVSSATLDLKGIQLKKLTIDSGVSDSTIDLSGEWQKDFQAKVNLGVGDVTLLLPKQTGLKLTVDKGLGSIDMKDFTELSNGVYVNDAYETEDISIDIQMDVGVGNVKLILVD